MVATTATFAIFARYIGTQSQHRKYIRAIIPAAMTPATVVQNHVSRQVMSTGLEFRYLWLGLRLRVALHCALRLLRPMISVKSARTSRLLLHVLSMIRSLRHP